MKRTLRETKLREDVLKRDIQATEEQLRSIQTTQQNARRESLSFKGGQERRAEALEAELREVKLQLNVSTYTPLKIAPSWTDLLNYYSHRNQTRKSKTSTR